MPFDPASNPPPASPPPPPERWDRRRHLGHRHRGHGIIPGLVLIAWGGLLLLRELGVLDPAMRAMDFWPLVVIGLGLGLSIAVGRRRLGSVLVGLAVTLLGAGMLAQRLGYAVGVAASGQSCSSRPGSASSGTASRTAATAPGSPRSRSRPTSCSAP